MQINQIIGKMPEDNLMMDVFKILTSTESDMYPHDEIMPLFESVEALFPRNTWVQTQKALVYYVNCDYDVAESIFVDIQKEDPYNLDSADTFSNILFVKQNAAELSVLAKTVYNIDRYRAESCCVVGKYFFHVRN
jgi:anaphase-promoting complex subunit 8